MSKADVCQISTWRVRCGIGGYTEQLVTHLEAIGLTVDVVPIDRQGLTVVPREELEAEYAELGRRAAGHSVVHIQHEFGFFEGSYGVVDSIRNFAALLEHAAPNTGKLVVTFHSAPPPPASLTSSLRSGVRQLLTHNVWRREVLSAIRRQRVAVIAPSLFLRRVLVDSGVPARCISVIPQGVLPVVEVSDAQRAAARLLLGYGSEDRVLSMFGFVERYKGHHVAVRALRSLPAEWKFSVVGAVHPDSNDLAYDQLLHAASMPALRERVRILGHLSAEDSRQHLAAADYCIAPYIERGLGTSAAITWGLASSRPVIGTRIPAFQELNRELEAMVLVTPSAPHELARALLDLDADPGRRALLVGAASELARRHSWPNIAMAHARVYGVDVERRAVHSMNGSVVHHTVGRRANSTRPDVAAAVPAAATLARERDAHS